MPTYEFLFCSLGRKCLYRIVQTNRRETLGRDVKDVLGRRSRDRGEGLSTLTPRVNDSSTSQQSFERVCETKSRAPALAQKT